MLPALNSERRRILSVVELGGSLPFESSLLRSEWAKYLSIVASGYLEEGIRLIFTNYTERRSDRKTSRYCRGRLKDFQNPSPEAIEKLVKSFDEDWFTTLTDYWTGRRRDSISSIVNNRHNAAHGRHFGTSLVTVTGYFKDADDVVIHLHDVVLGV